MFFPPRCFAGHGSIRDENEKLCGEQRPLSGRRNKLQVSSRGKTQSGFRVRARGSQMTKGEGMRLTGPRRAGRPLGDSELKSRQSRRPSGTCDLGYKPQEGRRETRLSRHPPAPDTLYSRTSRQPLFYSSRRPSYKPVASLSFIHSDDHTHDVFH